MRAGVMASALHVAPPSWHVGYSLDISMLDLGSESPDRHVALILSLDRTGVTSTPGVVLEVKIGDVALTIDAQPANTSARVVVAHGPVPIDGPLTYELEPGGGTIGTVRALTATWRGPITPVDRTHGVTWSSGWSFDIAAVPGSVGLVGGRYGGLSDWPVGVQSFDDQTAYALTDGPRWAIWRSRTSNAVGIWSAATFAPVT